MGIRRNKDPSSPGLAESRGRSRNRKTIPSNSQSESIKLTTSSSGVGDKVLDTNLANQLADIDLPSQEVKEQNSIMQVISMDDGDKGKNSHSDQKIPQTEVMERDRKSSDDSRASGEALHFSRTEHSDSLTQSTEQKCSICRRVYGSASIMIHMKACQALNEVRSNQMAAKLAWINKMNRRPSRPPGRICYICGRRYTTASWKLHIKQCENKWELWNSLLPKEKRHKLPPISPDPTDEEIERRVRRAHENGLFYFTREEALDEIMLEESEKNRLPLELIC
ncbi:Zinc finger protein [Fasciolopsis buskii]|uniref:Zinc finger protein n=1 Tax=Fasciolopsis buskii TaxID=27845 RepID=A0A8E0S8C2_9TREM|nr:Zinc finger protein [Fasciolopsis buski]